MNKEFDLQKSRIEVVTEVDENTQRPLLSNAISTADNEVFLRKIIAELKRADSKVDANSGAHARLASLQAAAEARLEDLAAARRARVEERVVVHDEAASNDLNTLIEFVAKTGDQATLDGVLDSVSKSDDLQLLQKALKKLVLISEDKQLQPSDQLFHARGLSPSDIANKLLQIKVALDKRVIELRNKRLEDAAEDRKGGVDSDDEELFLGMTKRTAKIIAIALLAVVFLLVLVAAVRAAMQKKQSSTGGGADGMIQQQQQQQQQQQPVQQKTNYMPM